MFIRYVAIRKVSSCVVFCFPSMPEYKLLQNQCVKLHLRTFEEKCYCLQTRHLIILRFRIIVRHAISLRIMQILNLGHY